MNDLNITDKMTLRELQYRCYVTQQFFENINLTVHRRSYQEEKPFTNKDEFAVYCPIHTGEKRYSCGVCHKSFTHRSRLIEHRRTHTGEKLYSCDVCHKLFSSRYYCLKVHQRTHTGEKPYSCDFCGRSFSQKNSLRVHQRKHTGKKPCLFDVCNFPTTVS